MFLFFSRLPRRAAAAGRKRNTARRVSFLGFRAELLRLGADILWDARVESLILQGGEGGAEGEGAAEGGGGVGSAAGGGGGGGGVGCGGVAGVVLRVLSGTLGRSRVLSSSCSRRVLANGEIWGDMGRYWEIW